MNLFKQIYQKVRLSELSVKSAGHIKQQYENGRDFNDEKLKTNQTSTFNIVDSQMWYRKYYNVQSHFRNDWKKT